MRDYIYNFANKGVSLVAGLILSVLLARYLGVELRGEHAFVIQTGTLLALVIGLGAAQSLPYFYRQDPVWFEVIRRLILIMWCLSSIVALGCLILTGFSMLSLVAITSAVCMGYQQMEAAMAVVNIRLKIRVNMLFSVSKVCFLAFVLLLPLYDPIAQLWGAIASMWTAWAASTITYFWFGGGKTRDRRLSWSSTREIVSFSWLPMITNLLVVLNYNIDLLLVRAISSAAETGLFAVALGLVTYLWVGADAVKEVLVSRVVRTDNILGISGPLQVALLLTMAGAALFAFVGGELVVFLYGVEFREAYPLAAILSFGAVSMVLFKILGVAVLSYGYRGFYFAALAAAVGLNGALALWWIPGWGATGAAWASTISYTFTGIAFLIYFSRKFQVPLKKLLIPSSSDLSSLARRIQK